jgi:sterol desaturase/sphingolipid hydroxylase (fatty acid hydroxylase superfamily)
MHGLLLFLVAFLLWLLLAYGIHRLAHWSARWNYLQRWHTVHHHPYYLLRAQRFRWYHLLLCFGSPAETLDLWFTLTLPLLLLCPLFPAQGLVLLVMHYLYEIFFSDARLDHNPNLYGLLTRVFAWGDYHLRHHRNPSRNYGLIITFWDRIFSTAC